MLKGVRRSGIKGQVFYFLGMSEEKLKAFLEAVKADAGLQEKLNAAADADAAVAIAKEVGFVISADELQRAQLVGEELTDEELEGVAGGTIGGGYIPYTQFVEGPGGGGW
jgi:predicted ribosomally synthesized peptide with nif11-like leader